ncbi:hypothetical protein KPH14_012712 [Odynerus spinipes]|uniref:Uncharacterized protein n=1 Tax=Odynerus spinipes TaxID=1348599 RepID=A0AAD9RDY9_9HYME|nr:hypothetical protein KPH14_012712 [Odynerus spinipes]
MLHTPPKENRGQASVSSQEPVEEKEIEPSGNPMDNVQSRVEEIAHIKLPPFWTNMPDLWFIQCKSCSIRAFLVGISELTLQKLADVADRLLESCGNAFIMSTGTYSAPPVTGAPVNDFEGRLTLLEKSMEAMLSSFDKL